MILCTGHDLNISFSGGAPLFTGLTFQITDNSHIGLTGINGCGKTTLFNLLSGRLRPDCGELSLARSCRLAYMEQRLDAPPTATLYEATAEVFAPLKDIESELDQINCRLLTSDDPGLIARQCLLQDEYQRRDGYTWQARTRSTLLGLGFSESDLELPVAALSGGQRSKALLARLLLSDANLLLLDEPTNHLDLDSLSWLEGFLRSYPGAYVIITHDRYFLDKVTNETWEITHQRLLISQGNYTAHKMKKELVEETIRRRYENDLREIHRIEGIIEQQRRFNQERNYVTIASKEKQLNRLREQLVAPESRVSSLNFRFTLPVPGGNDVIRLDRVTKSFGDKKLFADINLEIHKGERVFLLGANGCGKTTLLKIMLGLMPYDSGEVRLGINIHPGYYEQIPATPVGEETVLSFFTNLFPQETQTRIRTLLGSFLFSGDAVEKPMSALSGGERARLELLRLLMSPVNFLILDEPTNHLDIASREAVEAALKAYPGTLLIVSHDRYLINNLADRIYCLSADHCESYLGSYDEYLADSAVARQNSDSHESGTKEEDREPKTSSEQKRQYFQRKELAAQKRKLEKRIRDSEQEIEISEQRHADLLTLMSEPETAVDYQKLMSLEEERSALEEKISNLYAQWEEASSDLASFDAPD